MKLIFINSKNCHIVAHWIIKSKFKRKHFECFDISLNSMLYHFKSSPWCGSCVSNLNYTNFSKISSHTYVKNTKCMVMMSMQPNSIIGWFLGQGFCSQDWCQNGHIVEIYQIFIENILFTSMHF